MRQVMAAVEGTPVVVWGQDTDLRYTWIVNPRLGFLVEDVIGKTDRELVDGPSAARLERIKRAVIQTGEDAHEAVVTASDNAMRAYQLFVHAVRDHAGVVTGIACVAIEIEASGNAIPRQSDLGAPSPGYQRDDRAKRLLLARAADLRARASETKDAASRAYLLHLAEHWQVHAERGREPSPPDSEGDGGS